MRTKTKILCYESRMNLVTLRGDNFDPTQQVCLMAQCSELGYTCKIAVRKKLSCFGLAQLVCGSN